MGSPSYDGFTPRLGDFGLAKLAQDALADGSLDAGPETAASALLGTPSYMAPEQVGNSDDVGPATDVYALGVVLYELLTGRPPFQGPNVADVLDQVRHTEPVPVRRLRRDVPRDLETICLACLEKEPGRRYAGASELRDDLTRFLAGESIRARPPGWVGRTVKWVRRRPAAAGMVAVSAAAVVGLIVQQALHSAALEDANTELRLALRESLEMRYASDIRNAWTAYNEGDFAAFQRIIARYADGEPLAEYRGPEWYYLDRLTRTEGRELTRMAQAVYMATMSPDGKTIAVVGMDAIVRMVNYATGETVAEWATGQREVNCATYSPNGSTLWTTGDDGTIRTWDVATHRERMSPIVAHQPEAAFEVVYDADRELLISCGREAAIKLWDARTGEGRGVLEGHERTVETIKLHPDGRRLVSASLDHTIRVWDLTVARLSQSFDCGPGPVKDVCVSPDGRFLAVCSNVLSVWDLDEGVVLVERQIPDMPARACFAPNGERLYAASRAGVIHAFDLKRDINGRIVDMQRFAVWQIDADRSYAQAFEHKGTSLITTGNDGRVVAWNADGRTQGVIRDVECPFVWDFEFSSDSATLYATGGASDATFTSDAAVITAAAKGIYVRDLESPGDRSVDLETSRIWRNTSLSAAGTMFTAADTHLDVSFWSIPDLIPIAEIGLQEELNGSRPDLCFSHDGNSVIVWAGGAGKILFIEPHSGTVVDRYLVDMAESPAASPRDSQIAFSNTANCVQLHDWRSKRMLWESTALSDPPDVIAFSPTGDIVLASDPERVIHVWGADTGRKLGELQGHFDRIYSVAVSPDGRTIAGAGEEGTLSFWHRATGQLLFTLRIDGYDARRQVCQFSPDGRWIAVIAGFHRVRLLRLG